MNTEAQAGHDALVPSQRGTAGHQIHHYDSNRDQLLADLKLVLADAGKLLKEATDSPAEEFATLRARFERKLDEASAKIDRTRIAAGKRTKHAVDAAHAYVKENPWKSAGVVAAAGLIIGLFLRRR